MADEPIAPGKVVTIDYVLRDPDGKELERSEPDHPLAYLAGARGIVPGLERALTGKKAGDSFTVEVPPDQGYGPKQRIKPQRVLRSKFPAEADVKRGARFFLRGEDGRPVPIWVTKVHGREVQVTPQHPLAGVTLCFEVTVRAVRDATDEEKAHGHPHGPGGHDHAEQG